MQKFFQMLSQKAQGQIVLDIGKPPARSKRDSLEKESSDDDTPFHGSNCLDKVESPVIFDLEDLDTETDGSKVGGCRCTKSQEAST